MGHTRKPAQGELCVGLYGRDQAFQLGETGLNFSPLPASELKVEFQNVLVLDGMVPFDHHAVVAAVTAVQAREA